MGLNSMSRYIFLLQFVGLACFYLGLYLIEIYPSAFLDQSSAKKVEQAQQASAGRGLVSNFLRASEDGPIRLGVESKNLIKKDSVPENLEEHLFRDLFFSREGGARSNSQVAVSRLNIKCLGRPVFLAEGMRFDSSSGRQRNCFQLFLLGNNSTAANTSSEPKTVPSTTNSHIDLNKANVAADPAHLTRASNPNSAHDPRLVPLSERIFATLVNAQALVEGTQCPPIDVDVPEQGDKDSLRVASRLRLRFNEKTERYEIVSN